MTLIPDPGLADTQTAEFFVIDPWGVGDRFLKKFDRRTGLAAIEQIVGTNDAGQALKYENEVMATNAMILEVRPSYPEAVVRRIAARYQIHLVKGE